MKKIHFLPLIIYVYLQFLNYQMSFFNIDLNVLSFFLELNLYFIEECTEQYLHITNQFFISKREIIQVHQFYLLVSHPPISAPNSQTTVFHISAYDLIPIIHFSMFSPKPYTREVGHTNHTFLKIIL